MLILHYYVVEVFERVNRLLKNLDHRYAPDIFNGFGVHLFEQVHVGGHELTPSRVHGVAHDGYGNGHGDEVSQAQPRVEKHDQGY